MNLEKIIAAGAVVNQELVKRSIEWTHRDEFGNSVTEKFDVHIKSAISAADFDYIFVQKLVDIDNVRICKQVHRLVRLAEGTEVIPYETTLLLDPVLLMNLVIEINLVQTGVRKTEQQIAEEELSLQEQEEKN